VKLLLDEDVPLQLLEPLRHLLPGHEVDHVGKIGWKGKKDRNLLPDAAQRGYQALLTNDSAQLDSVEESRAIRDSGLHHIRYHQETRRGIDGLATAMGSVVAGIRSVVMDLEAADGQRLVLIQSIAPGRRHEIVDPKLNPPAYWPSRAGQPSRPRKPRSRKP
jgi:hypothetical protein